MSDTPETGEVFLIEGNWNAFAKQLKRERDEAIDAMETCRRVSRNDCEQNAKRAEELHVQNLTLKRERDEARDMVEKFTEQGLDLMDANRMLKRERNEWRITASSLKAGESELLKENAKLRDIAERILLNCETLHPNTVKLHRAELDQLNQLK